VEAAPLLLRLAAVLAAARLAAEVAERLRQPAVLAEIAAGVLLGPSVLGVVRRDDVLSALAELGAILLLFEVGMHMRLGDLRRVGASSLRVALIGVALPMAAAYPVARGFGLGARPALFLAGALTATSVGITARVFADLRVLASPEARTVLGAAVADDVAGLLILTVVLRVATGDAVSPAMVAGVLGIALAFVVAGTGSAAWLLPRALGQVDRRARAEGTMLVGALAAALALAGVASLARLAPIVGAFVAGVAVAASPVRDDLERRLAPVAHLLVPIFFLSMGVDTRVHAFADPRALAVAAALAAVAVAGKVAAGLGVARGTADRLLVGVAMVPRGEVGLIFAALGLAGGAIDAEDHAALLVVILATTVVTPPLLRALVRRRRAAAAPGASPVEPPGGWLTLSAEEVELSPLLAAAPPLERAGLVGLEAALACATRRPGDRLTAWLASLPPEPLAWDEAMRHRFVALLLEGNARSWRFLRATGLLARLLPEVDRALARRAHDPFDLEGPGAPRLELLDDLRALLRREEDAAARLWRRMPRREAVLLAAFAASVFGDDPQAASRLAAWIGLPEDEADLVRFLVAERHLLTAAAARLDAGEEALLELAAHVGTRERAEGLAVLAAAGARDPAEREAVDEIWKLLADVLSHPELVGREATDLVEARRRAVLRALAGTVSPEVARQHLAEAPRRYLLSMDPEAVARHLRMTETPLARGEVRLEAEPGPEPGRWTVHVVFRDRRGALAAVAAAMAASGVSIDEAVVATWRNGVAVDVFRVRAPEGVDWEAVRHAVAARLERGPSEPREPVGATVSFDDRASPWYTIVEIRALDRRSLLARVAAALARAGAEIHAASVATRDGVAVDAFWVTGRRGGKLTAAEQEAVRAALEGRPVGRVRAALRAAARNGG
jgi:Kef-type K+ transport system membrane component KefB/predicted amino acid-binding ACT domain protein